MNVVIDDLPDEVLVLIFGRFDLLEKLMLRAVCWRWKLLIEGFRIKNVSIVDSYFNRSKLRYQVGLESLNCQNLIYCSNLSNSSLYRRLTSLFGSNRLKKLPGSLQLVVERPMFVGLKSMFISFDSIDNFCFEKYINPHFQQLEQLFCSRMNLGETSLRLPKLKVLSMFELSRLLDTRIRLELPSMYKLLTDLSLNFFEFAHPQTVTHLFSPDDDESIARLFNLEYLSCSLLGHESATFSKLIKLKEIHLFHQGNTEEREQREERLAEIHQAKERLGKHELKMFVQGVDYETYRNRMKIPFREVLRSLLSRKDYSPVIPLFPTIVYDDLLHALGGQKIPSDLISNYFNVRKIEVTRIKRDDVDSFFRLLSDYPSLFCLKLVAPFDGLSDGQACYDSLPSRCRFLRELKIYSLDSRTTAIDLNFVLSFGYLQKLKLNEKLVPSNFVESLFGKLKYFQILVLSGKNRIKITKIGNHFDQEYLIKLDQVPPDLEALTFVSLSNLLGFCQKMNE